GRRGGGGKDAPAGGDGTDDRHGATPDPGNAGVVGGDGRRLLSGHLSRPLSPAWGGDTAADRIVRGLTNCPGGGMSDGRTTAGVARPGRARAGGGPAEPVTRALLARAVRRFHQPCAAVLYRGSPRLPRPPLNLQADEMLSAVVERLLKALREARPATVREFFA